MSKVVFLFGGIKSGKTDFGLKLALNEKKYKKRIYFATAQPLNEEMELKIKKHRCIRKGRFLTIEEPLNLKKSLIPNSTIIIDCINMWLNNMMLSEKSKTTIINTVKKWLTKIKSVKSKFIIISNEVGMGIVPDNPIGRKFQELLGEINTIIAENSDEVYFMLAGKTLKLK